MNVPINVGRISIKRESVPDGTLTSALWHGKSAIVSEELMQECRDLAELGILPGFEVIEYDKREKQYLIVKA
jgi:hypothetical protein